MKKLSAVVCLLAAAASTQVVAAEPETGWYWNPEEPGRGYFVERNAAGRVFAATFHYAPDGRATWFTGQAALESGLFVSPTYTFRDGQTLLGPWMPARADTPTDAFALDFPSATQGVLSWSSGRVPITRFRFGNSTDPLPAGAPENGWWWNPEEPGRGFAIEIQGNWLFATGFMYDDEGRPTWYEIEGQMASTTTPTRFGGSVLTFRDGQAAGAPHRAPVQQPTIGGIVIDFRDPRNAVMWLPDLRIIPLTRFEF